MFFLMIEMYLIYWVELFNASKFCKSIIKIIAKIWKSTEKQSKLTEFIGF